MASEKIGSLKAMSFYHADGFVPAFKQASRFAGKNGRLATMEDVARIRLATNPGDTAWENYYTTMTGEYFGYSKAGNRIIIVAHGVGPMHDLDGVLLGYGFSFKDKTRSRRGGRITVQQFLDLEAGKYGDVHVVDFDQLFRLFKYPFLGQLRASDAIMHPLLIARFGTVADDLIVHHAKWAQKYHEEEGHGKIEDPFIITLEGAANCSYGWRDRDDPSQTVSHLLDRDGLPLAHLISTSRLSNVHHQGSRVPCLMNDVGCHEWHDGVRLLALKADCDLSAVHPGVDTWRAVRQHWQKLMVPVEEPPFPGGFYVLTKVGEDTWFTQYPKAGERMDNGEPEFLVIKMDRVPGPNTFTTTVGGYHGFFKYGIKEVQAIAPQGANAYYLPGEVEIVWEDGNPTHHVTPIEFYRVEVDTSRRLMRQSDLANNYELLMKIIEANQAA